MTLFLLPFYSAGQQFTNAGNPNDGGLIYTYYAGTTSNCVTYTDNTGTTENSNPIVLNPYGRLTTEIWVPQGQLTRCVLKDVYNNTLEDKDDIAGINDTLATVTVTIPPLGGSGANNTVLTQTTSSGSGLAWELPGTFYNAAATVPVSVSFTTTPTFDCFNSNVFYLGSITASITGMTFSNPSDGQTINIKFVQDGTGSHTVTWPTSVKWPGGSAGVLSTAANSVDFFVATYDASTGHWYANLLKGFA